MCQSHYSSETEDLSEDHDEVTLRAKWCIDGANNLDEVIQKLHDFIAYVQGLKDEGYELIDTVNDDYGFCRKTNT